MTKLKQFLVFTQPLPYRASLRSSLRDDILNLESSIPEFSGSPLRSDQHRASSIEKRNHTAISSGISISIRRRAVLKVLPWASCFKVMVPPPPSASCSKKFKAPKLGNSNRSTFPLQIPAKCSLTRSAVTFSTRRG